MENAFIVSGETCSVGLTQTCPVMWSSLFIQAVWESMITQSPSVTIIIVFVTVFEGVPWQQADMNS